MSKNTFKLVKTTLACILIITSFSACEGKEIECDIDGEHVHLYINETQDLSRYLQSEKQYIGSYNRTNDYLPIDKELKSITINELYRIEDNLKYLEKEIASATPKREEYSYEYTYGTYYGYGYGYNYSTGKYDYNWGMKTGYHWDYVWHEIPLNEYTSNKVKDTTYKFRFYKLNEDGTISEKLFSSLTDLEEGYKYFKPSTLIQKNVSESYYLPKEKQKTKTTN